MLTGLKIEGVTNMTKDAGGPKELREVPGQQPA